MIEPAVDPPVKERPDLGVGRGEEPLQPLAADPALVGLHVGCAAEHPSSLGLHLVHERRHGGELGGRREVAHHKVSAILERRLVLEALAAVLAAHNARHSRARTRLLLAQGLLLVPAHVWEALAGTLANGLCATDAARFGTAADHLGGLGSTRARVGELDALLLVQIHTVGLTTPRGFDGLTRVVGHATCSHRRSDDVTVVLRSLLPGIIVARTWKAAARSTIAPTAFVLNIAVEEAAIFSAPCLTATTAD